jgi:hypothetical protein
MSTPRKRIVTFTSESQGTVQAFVSWSRKAVGRRPYIASAISLDSNQSRVRCKPELNTYLLTKEFAKPESKSAVRFSPSSNTGTGSEMFRPFTSTASEVSSTSHVSPITASLGALVIFVMLDMTVPSPMLLAVVLSRGRRSEKNGVVTSSAKFSKNDWVSVSTVFSSSPSLASPIAAAISEVSEKSGGERERSAREVEKMTDRGRARRRWCRWSHSRLGLHMKF